jgi:hypothetical protein
MTFSLLCFLIAYMAFHCFPNDKLMWTCMEACWGWFLSILTHSGWNYSHPSLIIITTFFKEQSLPCSVPTEVASISRKLPTETSILRKLPATWWSLSNRNNYIVAMTNFLLLCFLIIAMILFVFFLAGRRIKNLPWLNRELFSLCSLPYSQYLIKV